MVAYISFESAYRAKPSWVRFQGNNACLGICVGAYQSNFRFTHHAFIPRPLGLPINFVVRRHQVPPVFYLGTCKGFVNANFYHAGNLCHLI